MLMFLSGMVTAGFLVAAAFFFRFWQRTGDTLFAVLGVSFVFFALSQVATLAVDAPQDDRTAIFLLRLIGFVILLAGIVAKNMTRGRQPRRNGEIKSNNSSGASSGT
jgi:cytochrome c biogenesis protein CcdA